MYSNTYKTSKNAFHILLTNFYKSKIDWPHYSQSLSRLKDYNRANTPELINEIKSNTEIFIINNGDILNAKHKPYTVEETSNKKSVVNEVDRIKALPASRKIWAKESQSYDLLGTENFVLSSDISAIIPKFLTAIIKKPNSEIKSYLSTDKSYRTPILNESSRNSKERNLLPLILSIFLFFLTSCKNEEIEPSPKLNPESTGIINGKTITINNSNLDFLSSIKSNTTIKLNKNGIYELSIPIQLSGIENFVFDGNGATLKVLFNGKAIGVFNCSDITIKNFKIDNGGKRYTSNINEGRVHVSASSRVLIDSLTIYEQLEPGSYGPYHQIMLRDCSFSIIQNSIVEHSRGELITLESSSDCRVKDNKTFKGWSGIATKGSRINNRDLFGYRNYILNNEVYNADAASITINDRETIVENNLIQSTIRDSNGNYLGGPGIRFGHYKDDKGNDLNYLRAVGCKAINNRIINFTKGYGLASSSPVGIKVDATTDVNGKGGIIIEGNTIKNCLNGISVSNEGGQRGLINSNNINVLNHAIELYSEVNGYPQDFLVRHNNLVTKNSTYAIKIWYSNMIFEKNTVITETTNPNIYCIEISNNTENERIYIINNKLKLKGTVGIYHMNGALENAVIANNSISNAGIGMLLKCRNTLISNNIIDNVIKEGISLWNGSGNTTIVNNNISTLTKSCIYLRYTDNIKIDSNTLTYKSKPQNGYAIFYSDGNTNKSLPSLSNKYFNYPYNMRYN